MIPRRDVLRLLGCLTGVTAVLAACGQPPASGVGQQSSGGSTAGTAVAAASSAPPAGSVTTLAYWTFMPTASRFSGRPALFAPWEQQNRAKIAITEVDTATESTKLIASAAAHQLPDLLDAPFSMNTIAWGRAGIVTDMGPTIDMLGKQDFYPNFLRLLTCGAKTYGVPYMAVPQVLWYRKDLFQQKNATVPTTYDEWLVTAEKLTGTNTGTQKPMYGMSGFLSATHAHVFWQNMIGPNAGMAFDQTWKAVIDTLPQNLHAIQFMQQISKYFQPGAANANYGDTGNLLMDGTLGLTMSSTTLANGIIKTHADLVPKIGIAQIPFGPDGKDEKRGAYDDCYSWVVTAASKNVVLAKNFVQWFMTPSTYLQAFKTIDYGHVPVRLSTYQDPGFKQIVPQFALDDIAVGLKANQIGTLAGEDRGSNPLANLITSNGTWSNFLQRIYNKTDTPQSGLQWLQGQVNQLIQDNPNQLGCSS